MKTSFPLLLASALLLAVATADSQQRPNRSREGDVRMADTVKVGDPAPDFRLKTKDGTREVALSSFKGTSPVVLIFGSYT